jgi:two-component system invasion response regulator UvrY
LRFIKAGASGYLMKEGAPEELVKAIRKVNAGGKYVSASLAEKLVSHLDASDKPPHENLSNREFQILCMIAEGKTPKGIAVNSASAKKQSALTVPVSSKR